MKRAFSVLAGTIALVLGVIATTPALAQNKLDNDFLIQAVTSAHADMKYSELADSRSSNDKVKAFAKKIVKDHKDQMQNLDRFVSDRKLAIVAGLEKDARDEADRLGKLDGAAFDK